MSLDLTAPVLIVDDQHMMLRLLSGLVTKLGFTTVETCEDGLVALFRIAELRPSLVISDIDMKPMSGVDMVRAIRQDETIATTKIMLTTASRDAVLAADAVRAGADAFLLKPFTPQVLRERIAAMFKISADSLIRLQSTTELTPHQEQPREESAPAAGGLAGSGARSWRK